MPALSRCGAATVGGTLVAIGALGLYETYAADAHPGGDAPAPPPPPVGRRGAWTLAAGVAAGLQPDALFVIVPALALPTRGAAVAYVLTFVVGTVAAMGGYAAAIGATSRALAGGGGGRSTARLSAAASIVAIAVGGAVLAGCAGLDLPAMLGWAAHAH